MPQGITKIVPPAEAAWHSSLRGGPSSPDARQQQQASHFDPHTPNRSGYYESDGVGSDHPGSSPHQQRNLSATPGSPGGPSLGLRPGDPRQPLAKAPATEQDLEDALESLQHARERHRHLMKEVYGRNVGPHDDEVEHSLEESKMVAWHTAKHERNPTKRAVVTKNTQLGQQLDNEVNFLKSQLQHTASVASDTKKRIRNQMESIKGEVGAIQGEVHRLAEVVRQMSESCRAGETKVGQLKEELKRTKSERDRMVEQLTKFMNSTKASMQEAKREMATHDAEYKRLMEENEFFRVQLASRSYH